MDQTLDCKGMACPLPVINAKNAIEALTEDGTLRILVDNETAVQNLTRLGEHNGFNVASSKEGDGNYTVVMQVKARAGKAAEVPAETMNCAVPAKGGKVVVLAADTMGTGDETLGKKLMKAFVFALTKQDNLPETVLCYNKGAFLSCEDADTLEDLKTLEAEALEYQNREAS